MSSIFGGSKQSSTSSNQAYGQLSNALSGTIGNAGTGSSALAALLGGDSSGLKAFQDATGYNSQAQAGSTGITGSAAASGLLRSGSTTKGLQSYGTALNNASSQNYISDLLGQIGSGTSAAGVLGSAGSQTQSSGSSKPGIGGFIGSIGSGIAASDRRLKKNIHRVGQLINGLPTYQFRYKNDDSRVHIGVMAQDVLKVKPSAVSMEHGYYIVDYSQLEDIQEFGE